MIEFSNRQNLLPVAAKRLVDAARRVLAGEGVPKFDVSLVVVADEEMHSLNKQYLDHDYPTDVLSFLLERDESHLEGEVIVSAETANRTASRYGWRFDDELLLYVIHGTLHLAGYDDLTPEGKRQMRERERRYLADFQLVPRYDDGE